MARVIDKELADKIYVEVATRITKSCTIIINVDADGNADYEYIDNSIPTNPKTGEPYFTINETGFDGEWVAGEVKPIPSSEFGGGNE